MESSSFASALEALIVPLLSSLLISTLITWGLQGVLCVQVYNYYLSFPKDPIHMKLVVYASLALELAHTIIATRDAYLIYAVGFGDLARLDDLHLLWLTLPIFGGIAGLLCHLVFAYRISILSESKAIGAVITSISVCATIGSFVFGGKLFEAKTLAQAVQAPHIYLVCGLWNGFGALSDVVIAGCMSYYLLRNQTGFRNTDLLITRIIRMTIETGVATATASILSAILFVGFRQKLIISVYFVIPAIMITKLYSITILATFNNRPHAVGGPPPMSDVENSLFDEREKSFRTFSPNPNFTPRKKICIDRTVVQQVWTDPIERYELSSDATQSVHCHTESFDKNTKTESVSLSRPDTADSVILKGDASPFPMPQRI